MALVFKELFGFPQGSGASRSAFNEVEVLDVTNPKWLF